MNPINSPSMYYFEVWDSTDGYRLGSLVVLEPQDAFDIGEMWAKERGLGGFPVLTEG